MVGSPPTTLGTIWEGDAAISIAIGFAPVMGASTGTPIVSVTSSAPTPGRDRLGLNFATNPDGRPAMANETIPVEPLKRSTSILIFADPPCRTSSDEGPEI
jgi:hypothetical protein